MRRTMTRDEAALAVMTGSMDLTYGHDLVAGDKRVVVKPLSRDVVVDDFHQLAVMLDGPRSRMFEDALTDAASRGDDAAYARTRGVLMIATWTLGLSGTLGAIASGARP